MKNLVIAAAIFFFLSPLILLFGVYQNRTSFGECIGIGETRVPGLVYKVSTRNVILGIIYSGTIVVPAVVIFGDLYCPRSST